MIFKYIFITFFSLIFLYALIRPFSSTSARLFILFGSIFGILTLFGLEYTQTIADFVGIKRGVDLYLYSGLFTFFLFIAYSFNKMDALNKKISKVVKKLALNDSKNQNIDK